MKRLVAVALTAAMLTGCSSHAGAAESITAAVRQLPGVAAAESDFRSSWTGGARYDLTVTLDPLATPAQAAAVGQTFTDLIDKDGFSDSQVHLKVDYRATMSMSSAEFSFEDRPSSTAVSDSLRDWLAIARSAGVAAVNWSEGLKVTVGPVAKDSDLRAIAQNHPKVVWILIGLVDPLDVASKADLRETYEVTGMVPDQKLRDRWNEIVAELGDVGHVAARTDAAGNPPTNVTVNIPTTSGNQQQNLAQAWMTFPLLNGLPLPARVQFGSDIFTIGGCTPPDPRHGSSELEAELRRKFERC
ncbi:MAG: hypothetical protein KIH64_002015 [Mycobacterium sp.]|nr:hypothetical protein [Mycobacterium sp.]